MANFSIDALKRKTLGDYSAYKKTEESNIGVGTSLRKNHLGTPYFMDLIIDGKTFPNEPLITINGQKRIVETVVTGSNRRGTVKELISADDYRIRIEGICFDQKRQYPQKQVEEIISICEENRALPVKNDLLELFNVHSLVIKSYSFDKMQGQPHMQKYIINAISDEDFYAIIKEKDNVRISK
ncbi:hypothetical protein HN014_08135 [Aquimarina sp. TRL1]|uniref:DUF6046 domain-containing protein n=1 Tax=Aquimarina sp. (strain TRL1) TaxID=2736252 RepID=UPI00158EBC30|nr:DUF6046 domain-containing protein [Aquimarina sp. TRL1]QKX04887.1 hypothetical protein HN014_08135 [Aquimarina sp. TRL1]